MIDYDQAVISTATGRYADLANPFEHDLYLDDIAKALSKICRFTGHCSKFYSVAEHSVRVAAYLRWCGYTPQTQLAGLLHDATEAYLGDVSTPLKNLLSSYRALERLMESKVEQQFGVTIHGRADIKYADLVLLAYEKHHLLPMEKGEWPILAGINPLEYERMRPAKRAKAEMGWSPEKAEIRFRRAFHAIVSEPMIPEAVFNKCKGAS